ncbi:MAG TPA: ATP-dependent protease subunit HslV [Candidatus Eremiobacteraeota bacterium]|nr:ATP-dependent protease subunit HslV [Candidatus Eremiobacteraeota bacterium]
MNKFISTTIVGVIKDGKIALGGDGQVTFDKTAMKHNARKVRIMADGKVLAGFAGSAADGITLYEKFEAKLQEYGNNLIRAAVELAKEWRGDKFLRKLEALMIVGDKTHLLVLSGNGDVIEPDDNIIAIGSGGSYAMAAAKALYKHTSLSAEDIVRESLTIASEICVYTNSNINLETLG